LLQQAGGIGAPEILAGRVDHAHGRGQRAGQITFFHFLISFCFGIHDALVLRVVSILDAKCGTCHSCYAPTKKRPLAVAVFLLAIAAVVVRDGGVSASFRLTRPTPVCGVSIVAGVGWVVLGRGQRFAIFAADANLRATGGQLRLELCFLIGVNFG